MKKDGLNTQQAMELETVMSFENEVEENTVEAVIEEEVQNEEGLANTIVNNCCGKNEDGTAKAALTFSSEMWSLKGKKIKTNSTHSSYGAEITIQKRIEFIQMDLKFVSHHENDLKILWNMIERYGMSLGNITAQSKEIPFLSCVVVPLSDNGKYYITLSNPCFWALQSARPNEYPTVIRLYFKCEDMAFFETDEVDLNEIDAEVQRFVQQQEMQNQSMITNREKQKALDDERNARIEELRRAGKLN